MYTFNILKYIINKKTEVQLKFCTNIQYPSYPSLRLIRKFLNNMLPFLVNNDGKKITSFKYIKVYYLNFVFYVLK